MTNNAIIANCKTGRRQKLHPQKQRSKYICKPEAVIEAGNHFVWEFCPGRGSLNVPSNSAILHRKCQLMIAIPISARLILLLIVRLSSVRVRRRRLHQDTICGGSNGAQVQRKAGGASRSHLRDAEGAVQVVGDAAHPNSTTGHTTENLADRKARPQLKRKQHDHLEALRATAGRQNQENRFPLKLSTHSSPPPFSHRQPKLKTNLKFQLKNGARWGRRCGSWFYIYFYRTKYSSSWRRNNSRVIINYYRQTQQQQ